MKTNLKEVLASITNMVDEAEQLRKENDLLLQANLKLSIKKDIDETAYETLAQEYEELKSKTDKVVENANKHLQMLEQALREKKQAVDKYRTTQELLVKYKELGSPKKIKEHIKNYKKKCADHLADNKALKNTNKDLSNRAYQASKVITQLKIQEKQNNLATIYSKDKEHLLIFPAKLTMLIEGRIEKQITLLYITDKGIGCLIGLDEYGEPQFCSGGGIEPSKEVLEVAGSMLRKFKRQNWTLTESDLDLKNF